MSVPQHSSISENYITPKFIVDAYRQLLDTDIALDPATSVYNNDLYVKATNIYTEANSGLESEWKASNVFLNFPSSKALNIEYRKKYKQVCSKVWFNKFTEEYLKGNFEVGLIVLFSNTHLNILEFEPLTQKGIVQVCTLKQRLKYQSLNDEGELITKKSPLHNSSIVYVGQDNNIFNQVFSKFGNVWEHYYSIY